MIPGSANPLLLASAAAAPTGYAISRSLRFNSADSAYLSRTPASAGNRKTWTFSFWTKLSSGNDEGIFSAGPNTGDWSVLRFEQNQLDFLDAGGTNFRITTNRVFRDYSAWCHVVLTWDTTQATASNRIKLYVNGIQETALSGAFYPALNYDGRLNSANPHAIGREEARAASYFDGYLADIHFIDGQALDPTSFGEFDANGIWQPKAYTGTYPGNSFHLDFADNSTAAALGTDTSGNENTWTVNNISVAAGAGNDSLVDVPTNGTETDTGVGGEVRGNYCTLNPLDSSSTSNVTSNGNLDVTMASNASLRGTFYVSTGKWYYEVTLTTTGSPYLGLAVSGGNPTSFTSVGAFGVNTGGDIWQNGSNTGLDTIPLATTEDTYGIAFDADNRLWWISKNGAWYSADRAPDIAITISDVENGLYGYNFSALGGDSVTPHFGNSTTAGTVFKANFGQRPFAYTAPSGFKALCTTNLPAPTIGDGSTAMDIALYGGGASSYTISGLKFSPDLVWSKRRDAAGRPAWVDRVRGATIQISSDRTSGDITVADGLESFNSDGYVVGDDAGELGWNGGASSTFVNWIWGGGTSTDTNNDGSITSQVRANASAGFSIVTYPGNSTPGATVGHGLGVAPALIIIKARNNTSGGYWQVYHQAIGNTEYLELNSKSSAGTSSNRWNNTTPSSTVFTLGSDSDLNGSLNYVAYCFAPVDGYSSFGSYTGNGSTDGPFVYTGFRPKWILVKASSAASTYTSWGIWDSTRNPTNVNLNALWANENYGEGTRGDGSTASLTQLSLDSLSNGFKMRNNGNEFNVSAVTYVFAAFAENPFALNARAR